jgi:2-(1,2-epoxy-1,2-dihydrophenyl)acetyl-CoA isomerase
MGERSALFSVADGVGVITLNRPQARNAIDPGFTEDLDEAVRRCAADQAARAVLIRAEGPSFTVGGDVAAMAGTPPAELPALMRRITSTYHATLQVLDRLPVPVVASVHGAVAGGGLGLVYVADVVLAAESTRFAAGFAGLISHVVRDEDLTAEAETAASALAAGPTRALGEIRTLLRRSPDADLSDQLRAESEALARTGATRDAAHGIASFMAKATPGFEGC